MLPYLFFSEKEQSKAVSNIHLVVLALTLYKGHLCSYSWPEQKRAKAPTCVFQTQDPYPDPYESAPHQGLKSPCCCCACLSQLQSI